MNGAPGDRPCGPTVRRLHREREAALDWHLGPLAGRSHRGRRQAGVPLAAAAPAAAGGGPGTAPPWQRGPHPVRGAFPLPLAPLLDLRPGRDLLVLEGRIGVLDPDVPRPGDATVEWHRSGGRRVRFGDMLEERVLSAARLRLPGLRSWALGAAQALPYSQLDGGGLPRLPGPAQGVEAFVRDRLIPCLGAQARGYRPAATPVPPADFLAGTLGHLGRSFALAGGWWHELIPFFGCPPGGHFAVRVGSQQLLGLRALGQAAALRQCEQELEEAVLAAFPPAPSGPSSCDLYRDEVYAVICTPGGRFYVCQRVPEYVVEDVDGTLYHFEGVEIVIHVASTSAAAVIRPVCVQVMQEYRHMFVGHIAGGAYVCMPRPSAYFAEVHGLRLEEALLRHLEAARMTLCAGYTPDSAPWHPLGTLRRRVLSAEEAERRGLAVYWFPRPSGRSGRGAGRRGWS
ncbi:MAG: hypothetical protein ABIL09_29690 [Gemmatimonadota bacterium]